MADYRLLHQSYHISRMSSTREERIIECATWCISVVSEISITRGDEEEIHSYFPSSERDKKYEKKYSKYSTISMSSAREHKGDKNNQI